jgi:hypothetical protein
MHREKHARANFASTGISSSFCRHVTGLPVFALGAGACSEEAKCEDCDDDGFHVFFGFVC